MFKLPLISNKYKVPGMILFLICTGFGLFTFFGPSIEPNFLAYDFSSVNKDGDLSDFFQGDLLFTSSGNFMDELIILGILLGGCLWGFSKEKNEDEFLLQIRLNALLWAIFIHSILIACCTILFYGTWYLSIMQFNLVTPLAIFLMRYNYLLYKIRNA